MLPGEPQRRDDDVGHYRDGEVGEYRDHGHRDHHEGVALRHPAQGIEAAPLEGPFRHDEHQADQRGERDQLDQVGEEKDEGQQE